jgi:hypothetical protein
MLTLLHVALGRGLRKLRLRAFNKLRLTKDGVGHFETHRGALYVQSLLVK